MVDLEQSAVSDGLTTILQRQDPPQRLMIFEAALAIGQRRAKLLDEMRTALLEDDTEHVLDIARRLTGLEEDDEEEGDCATSRIN